MPSGQPKNLIPGAHKLTREDSAKGGRKAAEARRTKKAIKSILTDFLDADCDKSPQFKDAAQKLGLKSTESIKTAFTIMCVLHSCENGDLRDLEMLQRFIGEDQQDTRVIEDDPLTKSLKEEAEKMEAERKEAGEDG